MIPIVCARERILSEKIVITTFADESLIAESQPCMFQDESGIKLIYR